MSPADALNATRELFHFCYWLARTYGRTSRPDPGLTFKAELLPKTVAFQVFRALLENAVGEHSARMTAMENATKNTKELIGSLTLTMNRMRQAAITRELIEIVSGAEALKG